MPVRNDKGIRVHASPGVVRIECVVLPGDPPVHCRKCGGVLKARKVERGQIVEHGEQVLFVARSVGLGYAHIACKPFWKPEEIASGLSARVWP